MLEPGSHEKKAALFILVFAIIFLSVALRLR